MFGYIYMLQFWNYDNHQLKLYIYMKQTSTYSVYLNTTNDREDIEKISQWFILAPVLGNKDFIRFFLSWPGWLHGLGSMYATSRDHTVVWLALLSLKHQLDSLFFQQNSVPVLLSL